ncbi:MAG TPA: LLM class flavin-dependent oxidoreductase [Candidatus Limnocylindria bacterium]|nr:LLM class flavin-dependent oxidoreductase [Candidatus Limnocylindria bacterium]
MHSPGLGRIGAWGHLDTLAVADARAYARRVDQLGYGTLWVPETVGREPFTLLALLAGETSRMMLGTSVVSTWGRDAQATRMAAMTLAEATDGRFALGIGVSHPHLAEKLRGHRFERPLTQIREYLAAYRSAIYRGPMPSAEMSEPLVLVAALRERMTDLAATDADGAFPYLVTAERVAWMRARLDAAAPTGHPLLAVTLPVVLVDDSQDRDAARAYLKPYLRTPTYHASWELQGFGPGDWEAPGSDRLVDAMVAIGDVGESHRRIEALHAAGADHVAIIPIAANGSTEHLATLEALSETWP